MRQPTDNDIVEHIRTILGPTRGRQNRAAVEAAIECAITMLHRDSQSFLDAGAVNKRAKNLRQELEPLGDELQIPLEGCGERCVMTLREFRSAVNWFEHIDGPSPKFDTSKHLAAILADGLVKEFSQKKPSGTSGGQVRDIAGLIYQAAFGGEWVDLKRAVDAVRHGWCVLEDSRGR
jgi:hypothetical protein